MPKETQNNDMQKNPQNPQIVLDLAELYQNRNNTFNDVVETIVGSINDVVVTDEQDASVQAEQYTPVEIQKSDLLELRVASFPYAHYVTKMYLCGLLTEEQANEAMDIEQKLLKSLQGNLSVGETAEVSETITPHKVLGQLSLPLIPELVDDYLYRIDRISMVASLIDLNGKNLYKRHADVENYLPKPNIFSQAPDETAGCCRVMEELMLIRNDLHLVSGETQALLSQNAVTLYRHVVGEMLSDVPEHPLNRGVNARAAYMNIYFQTLIRDAVTPYEDKTVAENLLRAIKSVRFDVERNKFPDAEAEFDIPGFDNRPWQDIFASALDKAFLDVEKFYGPTLSQLHREKKIASQNKISPHNQGGERGNARA